MTRPCSGSTGRTEGSIAREQIDWSHETLTGHQLCAVHVDRQFDHAVDEAYRSTIDHGITDERSVVVEA